MRSHAIKRPVPVIAVLLASLSIGSSLAAASMVVGVAKPPQPATHLLPRPSAPPTPEPTVEFGHFEGY